MNTHIIQGHGQRAHHFGVVPDADFKTILSWVGDQVKFNLFIVRDIRNIDLVVEEGDKAIPIEGAGLAQAKDVLGRSVGFGQGKRAEETVAGFPSLIETQAGDLACGGVNLVVIVTIHLIAQDTPCFLQGGEVLESTGTDDAILKPAVGARGHR